MHASTIIEFLRRRGPSTGAEICAGLSTSQATLSRALRGCGEVVVAGAARATRYAARRRVPGLPEETWIYEIGEAASRRLARLHPVYPGGFYVESPTPLQGFYDDLPWFLNDLRPGGFLGRRIPQDFPNLGLPRDVRLWRADHVLAWLNHEGVEVPGSLVLGGSSARSAVAHEGTNPCAGTAADYERLAARALADGFPGSSAGGEQPKFLATRSGTPVMVKFSPAAPSPLAERVADLLRAEALALLLLAEQGFAVAVARVVEGPERLFLEVERFDRLGTRGRSGMVSLETLDAQFVGRGRDWTDTTRRLAAQDLVTARSAAQARWLDRFGAFIGNTDRHLGNLSYEFEGGRVGALAPVYDMLPMCFYPRDGELVERSLPLPELTADDGDSWREAHGAALRFWSTIAADPRYSANMRRIASESGAALLGLADVVARLPA